MSSRIKLAFFDMEGTVYRKVEESATKNTAPSVWATLSRRLGSAAFQEQEASKHLWDNKHFANYMDWMKHTTGIYRKHGITRTLFEQTLNEIEFQPGARETFAALHEKGVTTVLITGGFKYQADRAQLTLGIHHTFAACEYFWDGEKLSHANYLPCDYAGKVDFMQLLMQEYGLEEGDCAFVGDGVNDVPLAQAAGLSIAFNSHPRLQEACTYRINQPPGQEDFRAVLPYLLNE